jgi:hypothetical protein
MSDTKGEFNERLRELVEAQGKVVLSLEQADLVDPSVWRMIDKTALEPSSTRLKVEGLCPPGKDYRCAPVKKLKCKTVNGERVCEVVYEMECNCHITHIPPRQ